MKLKSSTKYQSGIIGWEIFKFFNNPNLHDVILSADIDKFSLSRGLGKFYAHRDILRGRSSFFHKVFSSIDSSQAEVEYSVNFEEEKEKKLPMVKMYILNLNNVSSLDDFESDEETLILQLNVNMDALELALRFIYKGTFDLRSVMPDKEYLPSYYNYVYNDLLPQVMSLAKAFELNALFEFLRKNCGRDPSRFHFHLNDNLKLVNRGSVNNGIKSSNSLTIKVGEYRFENLSAVLLSARSSFFSSVLSGLWNEAKHSVIDLMIIPIEPLSKILSFINMEVDIELKTVGQILDVLQWSFYLGVPSLISYCEHILDVLHLNTDTVCPIWNLVCNHVETENLASKCEKMVEDRFMECAQSSGFLELRYDLLKGVLNAGKVSADSLHMMMAIKRWVDAQGESGSKAKDLFFQMLPPFTMFNVQNRMILLGLANGPTLTGIPRSALLF